MVILSSISVAAYKCVFHDGFLQTPESYFFHLFYYRSRYCSDSSVDWGLVGIEQVENITEILRMPDETLITTRNFQISLAQLVVNCLLVVTSFVALGKIKFSRCVKNLILFYFLATTIWHLYIVSRKISYWILFVPYCLILHISMVLDFIGGTSYADDRLRSFVRDFFCLKIYSVLT
jgi:hypothetical protein